MRRFESNLSPGRGNKLLFGDWPVGSCIRGLVVGHYQPLADNQGIAPRLDQTGSLQSIQRTLEKPISLIQIGLSADLMGRNPRKAECCPR